MKIHFYLLSILLVTLLTACPGASFQPSRKKLRENGMDFPDLKKRYYQGIQFQLSDLFSENYENKHVLQQHSYSKKINDLNVYFDIESFSQQEAREIQFDWEDEESSLLEIVHYNYVYERQSSLEKPATSLQKNTPTSVGFQGIIQVIEGASDPDMEANTYLMATLEIDKRFFVFQLIGNKNSMRYLYDDFMEILSSVEKKK